MPKFYKDVEIDLSVDEFIMLCSENDIYEFVDKLKSTNKWIIEPINGESILKDEFNKTINKIYQNRLQLTQEEDELLKKIANRF